MTVFGPSECENPHCSQPPVKKYSDGNGNVLRVCERHYYTLVSSDGARGRGSGSRSVNIGGSE